ncbi:MAG: exodeoxyribonuclease VII large subunit [Oscillospiraceae bacterium]|nr:exodeoxyribonuclease VII large subunit [Oscillospiraceae bacterium]
MDHAITVSQINRYLKLKMDHDVKLNNICVVGEISNFTNHLKSGHFYFSLKDNESSIKAVMFHQHASKVSFSPKDGQKVIIYGQISVFERDGIYQIYATKMLPDGAGELALAFEQLKEKLQNEGLFDLSHKKPLPPYPEKIGIITSPMGAAVQDMLNIFSRRFPACKLLIYPALVQGDRAAESIMNGIEYFHTKESVDVILIGRGGGSAEDLWCFNDEMLARSIYNSKTPIVSCIGHETDFTIADFVSDLRAPTPSAAAELCVPDSNTVRYQLSELGKKTETIIRNKLDILYDRINMLSQRPCLKNSDFYLQGLRLHLSQLMLRPCIAKPETLLKGAKTRLEQNKTRLLNAINQTQFAHNAKLSELSAKLDALSPLKVLSRGYSLVTQGFKSVSAKELVVDDEISIRFWDGKVEAKVTSKKGSGANAKQ